MRSRYLFFLLVFSSVRAFADISSEPVVGIENQVVPKQVEVKPNVVRPITKSPKGSQSREKEAEGTQAPNRFKSDPVIKSKYEYNGEQLEVDPD